MPSSSVGSYDPIEQSLQTSLNGPSTSSSCNNELNNFEDNLLASSKKVLLTKIDFETAEKNYSFSLKNLKNKYIHLNAKNCKNNESTEMNGNGYNHNCEDDGIPRPKVMIHPPERVTLGWQRVYRIGAGLMNMGNTCFLNAILQCLTYTPPLVNHLIEFDEHSANCKTVGFCMMCELFRHIRRALEKNGETIKPQCILQKLKAIAKHMAWGRQEDAHEFLRYIMESMIKSSLKGYSSSSLDRISLETTVVNHIFGGYHRSQVICLKCKSKSDTYDHFMDIILDIKTVPSLEKAMEKFVQPEILDNDNAYLCPRCMKKCPAQKRFTIHRAPNIATFQLKRFDYNRMMGGKITKHISFPEKLDLRPYMSQTQGSPVRYQLYAVLVHQGVSCNSGHYFCFVRNSNNLWYCMDDCRIRQVTLNYVLSQQAYLLFYTRVPNNPTYITKSTVQSTTTENSVVINGNSSTYDAHNTSKNSPLIINNSTTTTTQNATCTSLNGNIRTNNNNNNNNTPRGQTISATGPFIPLPANREKVAFGIKPNKLASQETDSKHPRIVMRIIKGTVTTSATPKNEIATPPKRVLVPYVTDSSEESDQENRTTTTTTTTNGKKEIDENDASSDTEGKIKATTSVWVVTDGAHQSPSESSNESVNSTSDWTVTNAEKIETKNDRMCPGWTITEKGVPPRLLGGKELNCQRRYFDDDSMLVNHRRNNLEEDNRRHSDTEVGRIYFESECKGKECDEIVNGHEKKERKRRKHDEQDDNIRVKRKKKMSSKRQVHTDNSHSSDESSGSEKIVWVEKTKETMEKERQQNCVPAKHWDENIKDVGYCRPSLNGKDNNHWDDRRHSTNNNNGVVEYFKNTHNHAYGSKVNSWNGGQSSLDRDTNSSVPRWQDCNDDYDAEYDKGREKKTKFHKRPRNEYNRYNPFQRCQNERNHYNSNYNKQDRPSFNSCSRKSYFHHNNHRNYHVNSNFKYHNNKFRGKKQNGGL